ncbi:MAG: BON domain-containing protein [Phenylobacterium sp.]
MAGRWTDNHQDEWRARDDEPWFYGRERETRTFRRDRPEGSGGRRSGLNRDPVFGERESGASYGGGARGRVTPRFTSQDYTGGGRYYGDDGREAIYREEYGQGGVEYGDQPRGYDAGRGGDYGRAAYDRAGYGEAGYDDYPREPSHRMASGGTGGYDYERGYGDGGRRDDDRRAGRFERTERFEGAGRNAGEFLHRAGERMASWFGGGGEARAYHDYDREGRGARGLGPQGYKRSDERISDEVHERLTDDSWLDASNISVSVATGEVTLSGTVESREAKHRAERIVEDISGVAHVQNNLRCAPTSTLQDSDFEGRARDPSANGAGGAGSGQSTAGRKS